ncbi:MAG: sugar ABC transporter permease [candidate division FCPU426 bacterium]
MKASTKEGLTGYLFISPWLLGFTCLLAGPILFSLLLSFADWNGIGGVEAIRWVGLDNFKNMASDERFPKSVYNTFVYTLGSVPLIMTGGILIALLMNQKLKSIALFRTIFYLPSVTAGVASTLLWFYIFQPQYGLFNYLIEHLGILLNFIAEPARWIFHFGQISFQGPEWLANPRWVKTAYVVMSLWGIGSGMIIYLAGLQGIPEQLYEAADIDGASSWQQFLNVTMPMLSPVIFFNLILTIVGSFQIFTQAYILSGGNGSPADAALFFVLYIYQQAFQFHHFGYASAMAWILFLIILGATMLQFKFSGWVYYEGEVKN